MHSCRIVLPNSYAPGDGKVVVAEATAPDAEQAEEDAGCAAFALLCADKDGLSNVVFRPAHWKVPIETLVEDIGRIVDSHVTFQPLAVHQRAPASFAGELQNVPEADLHRAADLIRVLLEAHDGSFAPSKIDHKKFVQVAGQQEKAYAQLAGLLPKGSLRQFIEQHPEFDYEEKEGRMYIKWRAAAPQGPPSTFAASGALSAPASRSEQKNDSSLTAAAFGAPSASASGAPPDVKLSLMD